MRRKQESCVIYQVEHCIAAEINMKIVAFGTIAKGWSAPYSPSFSFFFLTISAAVEHFVCQVHLSMSPDVPHVTTCFC